MYKQKFQPSLSHFRCGKQQILGDSPGTTAASHVTSTPKRCVCNVSLQTRGRTTCLRTGEHWERSYFRDVQQASAIDIVAGPINHSDQAEKGKIGPYGSKEECKQSIGGNNKRKKTSMKTKK